MIGERYSSFKKNERALCWEQYMEFGYIKKGLMVTGGMTVEGGGLAAE